ncbi:MAG: hypothetical protein CBE00_10640 [Planctomycetaceae bacterium TMED240]|nr:hypothetical protein [Rhodopirellula sp.]OUX05372.1 MAG: hypothetical protein CBE00_10640 [Planctomycetaceae bacterium TMED240]
MEIQRELETFSTIDTKRQKPSANKVHSAAQTRARGRSPSYLVSPHLMKASDAKWSNFITKTPIFTPRRADQPKSSTFRVYGVIFQGIRNIPLAESYP